MKMKKKIVCLLLTACLLLSLMPSLFLGASAEGFDYRIGKVNDLIPLHYLPNGDVSLGDNNKFMKARDGVVAVYFSGKLGGEYIHSSSALYYDAKLYDATRFCHPNDLTLEEATVEQKIEGYVTALYFIDPLTGEVADKDAIEIVDFYGATANGYNGIIVEFKANRASVFMGYGAKAGDRPMRNIADFYLAADVWFTSQDLLTGEQHGYCFHEKYIPTGESDIWDEATQTSIIPRISLTEEDWRFWACEIKNVRGNGSISVTDLTAAKSHAPTAHTLVGEEVEITLQPEAGYDLLNLSVYNEHFGTPVELEYDFENDTFSYISDGYNAVINAEFSDAISYYGYTDHSTREYEKIRINGAPRAYSTKEGDDPAVVKGVVASIAPFGMMSDGWYDRPAEEDGAVEITEIPTSSRGEVKLYAHYTGDFSIRFKTDETNFLDTELDTYYGTIGLTAQEISAVVPTPVVGREFIGWFDKPVGGTQVTSIPAGTVGDLVLYAHYSVDATVTGKSVGGFVVDDPDGLPSINDETVTRIPVAGFGGQYNYTNNPGTVVRYGIWVYNTNEDLDNAKKYECFSTDQTLEKGGAFFTYVKNVDVEDTYYAKAYIVVGGEYVFSDLVSAKGNLTDYLHPDFD